MPILTILKLICIIRLLTAFSDEGSNTKGVRFSWFAGFQIKEVSRESPQIASGYSNRFFQDNLIIFSRNCRIIKQHKTIFIN